MYQQNGTPVDELQAQVDGIQLLADDKQPRAYVQSQDFDGTREGGVESRSEPDVRRCRVDGKLPVEDGRLSEAVSQQSRSSLCPFPFSLFVREGAVHASCS